MRLGVYVRMFRLLLTVLNRVCNTRFMVSGDPHLDPQIGGAPYNKDPIRYPLISETPSGFTALIPGPARRHGFRTTRAQRAEACADPGAQKKFRV